MSRTISLTAQRAINAAQTSEVFVFLLTVTHESLGAPLRFSTDNAERISDSPPVYGTTSRGDFYTFLPISLMLPDDSADTPPSFKLVIDNINRQLIPLLRSISTPPSVTIEMVLASAPDLVEQSWPGFDMVNATYTAEQVQIDLTFSSSASEGVPAGAYNPAWFPGLFRA